MNKKDRKWMIKVLQGLVLSLLAHKSDKFRWVYWLCRGQELRRAFKRNELMEEVYRGTVVGKAYLQTVAHEIADDLET